MFIQAFVPWRQGSGAGGSGDKAETAGQPQVLRCGPSGGSGRTSSTYAPNPTNAWIVNLNDGNVNNNDKTNTNYAWPVRGGE